MMNSFRKGSDASSGFFSESFSSQNGLKTPPPVGSNHHPDFMTRKWKSLSIILFMDIQRWEVLGGYRFASATYIIYHQVIKCRTTCCMSELEKPLYRVTDEAEPKHTSIISKCLLPS